jgi:hypothetical protein
MASILVSVAIVLVLGFLAFGAIMLRRDRDKAEAPKVIKSVPLIKTKWKPTPHRSGGSTFRLSPTRKIERWAGRWMARHNWTMKGAA